ncbi:MAG TPA: hypothetical protein VHO69_10570, partial [Phototrophicaceae bacterium]|nr:hypothetical protein [Phototrophicaceae bacterium]
MKTRFWILLAACALLAIGITPVLAQTVAPKITVAPNWGPPLQLTTLDTNAPGYPTFNPGDDYRYVMAYFDTTTTVEFWAVEINCTANGNVLDIYNQDFNGDNTPDHGEDNRAPVEWNGTVWDGQDGWTNYTSIYTNVAGQLKISAVASKRGRNQPLGRNGVQTSLTLGSIQFRVKPTAGTSPLTCTFSFLDRNGKVVVPATYTPPPPVTVISGYSVTGTVSYQARTVKNNIGVNCWIDGSLVPGSPFLTNASGVFTISNIRTQNHINCRLYGNISHPSPVENLGDMYLATRFNFNIGEHGSYRELPIELKAGNVYPEDCDSNP